MRRRTKFVVALLLIAASLGLVLWNTGTAAAPPALTVSDAKFRALEHPDTEATVRGNVVEGSIVESGGRVASFLVEDGQERLLVFYNDTPPDNFGAKQVVVQGTLGLDDAGLPVLRATSIQVGCASKY
jgi:cytochrome c-type biogenesis protein CcmE